MENCRYRKCVICGIRKLPKSSTVLASFPLDPDRCRLWVKASGIEDFVHVPIEKLHQLKYVCGSHFAPECFNAKGNRLLSSAVPTLRLNRPLLSDDLFAEFPLHVKSYYAKFEKGESSKHRQTEILPVETIPKVTKDSDDQALNLSDKKVIAIVNKPSGSDDFIPIPSTSKAPMHLTFKRKEVSDDVSDTVDKEILVQSYKTSRKRHATDGKTVLTKRELRILKRLQEKKITIKSMTKSLIDFDKLDSDLLKSIIENAVKNQKKAPHGKRWDEKNKIYALSMFKRSPKTYRYLQKMLPLPSTRTLQRILKEIPMEPGIHTKIIQILSEKAEAQKMKEEDKQCVILFDEMALKKRLIYNEAMDQVDGYVDLGTEDSMGRCNKVSGHALVFMIQFLKKKFKQPIAHYFVEGTIETEKLAVLIKNIVRTIHAAGFNVVSTVCDQGPTNIGAMNLLKKFDGLTSEDNYFFVDKRKVHIIFDVPHLFKSIRNNFFQAGVMKYKGKEAKWSHLKEAEEKNRNFLNFPKITQTVVHPTYKTKMRVKFAAHALSNTMAAVLKMMAASSNSNAEDYNNTAFVVEEMDKLFNWTNGPASPKDVIPRKRENVSEKTNHQESWNYYLKHIDSIQFLKSDSLIRLRNVRCINGFKISLKSLKDIWYFLNKEANFKYLNLRQLNQDSLENLFGTIRQHSATNRNPTCSHFNSALKSSIISGLSGPHSRGSNCEIDCNKLFISHREITKSSESVLVPPLQALDSQNCDNQTSDYPVLSLPEEYEIELVEDYFCNFEEQPTVYVSGYLAGKVLSKFNCDCCQFYLKEDNPDLNNPLYKWISLKEWWQDKVSLTYPKIELCFLVSEAKHVYMTQVLPELHQRHIAQFCTLQLSTHCSMQWFKCNTHCKEVTDYLLSFLSKLFIRKSCKIKNDDFAKSEINEADKIKKAQQQNKDL